MRLYKYYIALLMTMLVACSEGGSLEENIPDNIPVELGAYASKYSDTRAGGILGNNDLASIAQNGGFGVYSYFMHTQEFMNNQQVTAVTRDIEGGGKEIVGWTYSPMKYWPNNPSSTLDFFAYAPYARPAANETSGIISVDDTNHIPIVSYQLDQYGKNVDLMWGTNGDTSGAKNVFTDMAKPSVNQKVEFKFKHTLAKIGGAALNGNDTGGLTIQLDVDNNGNITGGKKPASTKVTVSKIVIKVLGTKDALDANTIDRELPIKGDFNLTTGVWSNYTRNNITLFYPVQTITKTGLESNAHGKISSNIVEPGVGTGVRWEDIPEGVTVTAQNVFEEEFTQMLLLPGDEKYPVIEAEIDYVVRTKDEDLELGYTEITHHITKEAVIPAFPQMAKRYNLRLHIGVGTIKFDASGADDWNLGQGTFYFDKTSQTERPGPGIEEDNPSGDDLKYLSKKDNSLWFEW